MLKSEKIKKYSTESIEVVVADDQRDALQAHIKKYGAFSKFDLARYGG